MDEGTLSREDPRKGYEKAIELYDDAIRLKPDYLEAYNNRSSALRKIGRYREAIADCTVALSLLNPYEAKSYYLRGMAWIYLHEWDEAETDLKNAKEADGRIADWFKDEGYTREDFERSIDASLPEGIWNLLTNRDAE